MSPEPLAAHTAQRLFQVLGEDAVIVFFSVVFHDLTKEIDAMSGCGGNTIQFALLFKRVIAVETSLQRLQMAQKNAEIYGVRERIQYILGDFFEVCDTLQVSRILLAASSYE